MAQILWCKQALKKVSVIFKYHSCVLAILSLSAIILIQLCKRQFSKLATPWHKKNAVDIFIDNRKAKKQGLIY